MRIAGRDAIGRDGKLGIRVIKAGLMKEGAIASHLETFCDSKLPWVNAQPGTICFPRMPPAA